MIKTELLGDGRTRTWSDRYMKIQREDGVIYDDAVDVIKHTYIETDIPIEDEATIEDYQTQMEKLGVSDEHTD